MGCREVSFRFVREQYTSRSFLGQWQGLFAAKLGEELDVSVLWVELGLEFCQVGTELRELETQR